MAEAGTKVFIPDELQALIILAKLPSSMTMLTQMVSQQDKIEDLKLDKVRRSIILSWEQTSRQCQGCSLRLTVTRGLVGEGVVERVVVAFRG